MVPRCLRHDTLVIAFGLIACAIARTLVATPPTAVPLQPGEKQLFLDDHTIDVLDGVRKTMHQVRKWPANPVLRPEHPWELNRIATRGAPLWNRDRQRWEFYYFAHAVDSDSEGRRSYTCLAVSDDGVTWTKPNVEHHDYNDSKTNNIVEPGSRQRGDISLFHTLYDPSDLDPARRFKGFIGERNPLPAASADGLNWTLLSEKRIPSGEASYLFYDSIGKQYVATLRYKHENRRAVRLSVSKDFIGWTDPALIYYADERDQERGRRWLRRHLNDPTKQKPYHNVPSEHDTQVYAMGVFPYEGVYVGLPIMYHHTGKNDGLSDVSLSVSRDLHSWERVGDGQPFIPLSSIGEGVYDSASIQAPASAIRRGDELWFYYSSGKYRGRAAGTKPPVDAGGICLAKLRLDGFVSLDAGTLEGSAVTKPLRWRGDALWINADASGGEVRVEVLDETGKLLDRKYAHDQTVPIDGDGVRLPVRWRTGANLSELEGKIVRLRFWLRHARLYAFWTENDGSTVRQLIARAGNADHDRERLQILRHLQNLSGLDAQLKADVDTLVSFVTTWVESPFLPFFWRAIRDDVEYDFGISQGSPIYPLTRLFRGRMLVWNTLEMGHILRSPELRHHFLTNAVADLEATRRAYPENRIARMYLGEPLAWEKSLSTPKGAPRWAVLQRENIERLTDIIRWWIDHRMQPDGQYGGGWGDDCEMWRWWVPVLLGFDDATISGAQSRFSTALMSQPHMQQGYTTRMTDVEHTAEDSADAITPMMHLDPENPEWKRRALRLAEFMEKKWAGTNDRGFLQFRSTYFTADRVEERPRLACDTVYHPRAVQPALLLWQRTADPNLTRLFSAWMKTWVDAAARGERGKPVGIVPSAIHWPSGKIGGLDGDWWDPRNHDEHTLYLWPSALSMLNSTLLLTYHMTGEEKYLAPLRSMASIRLDYLKGVPVESPPPGSQAWCASRLGSLARTLAKYRHLTGSSEFDALLTEEGFNVGESELYSDRAALEHDLERSANALRINFEGYTSEVRWTDRVLSFPRLFQPEMMYEKGVGDFQQPNPGLLYRMVTGDPDSAGYFPLNAVRWRTPPRDISVLVTHANKNELTAELFHFGADTRPMQADLFLLTPGAYMLTLSTLAPPTGADEKFLVQSFTVSGPVTRVAFELPSQQTILFQVRAN